jgi:hypothetical protein
VYARAGGRHARTGCAEPGVGAVRCTHSPTASGAAEICPLAFPWPAACEAMHRETFAGPRPAEEWKEALEVCYTQHTLYLDKLNELASELCTRPTADGAALAEQWAVTERGNEHTDFPTHRARLCAAMKAAAEDRASPFPSGVRSQLEQDLRTERRIIAGLCCFRAAQRRAGAGAEGRNREAH